MVFTNIVLRMTSARVPLIKFRRGGLVMSAADQGQPQKQPIGGSAANSSVSAKFAKTKSAGAKGPVIEDWQLAPRYRRKAFDQEEIDYINRGGPA